MSEEKKPVPFVANVLMKEVDTVRGSLATLREKWREGHHKKSMASLGKHGLQGACLVAVPGRPNEALEFAWWKSKEAFKAAKGITPDKAIPEWKEMVQDLTLNTWKGPIDKLPPNELPRNFEFLEGDPIPEEILALPIWIDGLPA